MRQLIQSVRLLCPAQSLDQICDIAIAEGCVVGYGEAGAGVSDFTAEQTYQADGLYLFPGLVDIATSFGEGYAGDATSEARAAARAGVTTMLRNPSDKTSAETIWASKSLSDATMARIYPLAPLTAGNAGEQLAELGELKSAGCVGATNAGKPIADSLVLRRAMQYAASFALPLVLNPIDAMLTPRAGVHESELSTRMGIDGVPVSSETTALLRDIAIADDLGVSLHAGRLSAGASLDWVSMAKSMHKAVTCDVSMHHLLLSVLETEGFQQNAHLQPPLRAHEDRERLLAGLKRGEIDILTSDHRPLSGVQRDAPFTETATGASGVELLLPLVWHLIAQYQLPILPMLASVSSRPAAKFGLSAGSLAIGQSADMVLYDPEMPNEIVAEKLYSAGKNILFDQWLTSGTVLQTWIGGEVFHATQSPQKLSV